MNLTNKQNILKKIIETICNINYIVIIVFLLYNLIFLLISGVTINNIQSKDFMEVGIYLSFLLLLFFNLTLIISKTDKNLMSYLFKIITLLPTVLFIIQIRTGFAYVYINYRIFPSEIKYLNYILFNENIILLYTLLLWLVYLFPLTNIFSVISVIALKDKLNLKKYVRYTLIIFFVITGLYPIVWFDETVNIIMTRIIILIGLYLGYFLFLVFSYNFLKNLIKKERNI